MIALPDNKSNRSYIDCIRSKLAVSVLWINFCYHQTSKHQPLKESFQGVLHPSKDSWKIELERLRISGIADNLAELWLRLQVQGAGGMRVAACGAHVVAETH